MSMKMIDRPKVERVEEQDRTQPVFWTAHRFATKDTMFPLAQVVQVRTAYNVVTGWQVWAGPGKWAFHTEADALKFISQRFGVGPYADKKRKMRCKQ